jgi:hypothetical protein
MTDYKDEAAGDSALRIETENLVTRVEAPISEQPGAQGPEDTAEGAHVRLPRTERLPNHSADDPQ